MSFFLIVWNMEIYMHDIVNVELLDSMSNSLRSGTNFSTAGQNIRGNSPPNLNPQKKGLSSKKDGPPMLCLSFK